MPIQIAFLLFTIIFFLYSVVAQWLSKRSITAPMVFVVVGAAFSAFGWISLSVSSETIKRLVELTLALLLFADATTLNFRQVKEDSVLPGRLLLITMPLIILLGGLTAFALFPGEEIGFAFLIASILAPTDAALGLPIFANKKVPVRIRRALNVESGLNDGLATPFVSLFAALAVAEFSGRLVNWFTFALLEIAIAIAVGVGVGLLGGWLMRLSRQQRLSILAIEQTGVLALPLIAYLGSLTLGGNGFIAAFVGGMIYGYIIKEKHHQSVETTERIGNILSVVVWTIFGAYLVLPLFTSFNPMALLYALLSLTFLRMLPVALALRGLGFRWDTRLLMGWLGPRGLASVVFTIIAFESFLEVGRDVDTLFSAVGWTILLSVLLHGFSAKPLAIWYARRLKTANPGAPEFNTVSELEAAIEINLNHEISE
jgi:NhaP-type Na+/H+ or K+/H+ antiporter